MKITGKKILLFTVVLLSLIGLIFAAIYLKRVADYKKAVKETTFSGIDICNIPNGIYVGEYDVDFVYAKVEVTVRNGIITNIDILEHQNGRGGPAEIVADRMIEEQKIDVDIVAGATNSSIVIKKAVENALKGENEDIIQDVMKNKR
ncbi:FMN-binding protein [Parablautia muri]|uniref:FMN-binding protein n=1 Tax=Parablautia muri TaxID=2320879 RepID=A0A9X5BK65_9FIRM|nr:FMN-binding protein [Parablautia muri]NBJ95565.1 FMN-binding protein [Parablautia muri]